MRLLSWNVNGLRAILRKGFIDFINETDADIISLQEIKMQKGKPEPDLPAMKNTTTPKDRLQRHCHFHQACAEKKSARMNLPEHDTEGRILTLEYEKFQLVNVYTPNSQRELQRLEYRGEWDDRFREYVNRLDEEKPVIICGDLNVAHKEIDLKNPDTNRQSAGFTDQEREKFTALLESGFTDSFRHFYPDKTDAYTWWSYITGRAVETPAGESTTLWSATS